MTNLFDLKNISLENEVSEILLEGKQVRIERIVSKGHKSDPGFWYDQGEHEWVCILKGKAIVEFENGEEVTLLEGDHLNIEAHQKHKVSWTDPKVETVWLAVFYP